MSIHDFHQASASGSSDDRQKLVLTDGNKAFIGFPLTHSGGKQLCFHTVKLTYPGLIKK